jgi:mono/diheme cytochrome c family protein
MLPLHDRHATRSGAPHWSVSAKENRVGRCFRILVAALALACAARIVTSAQGNPEAAKVKNPVAATPESIAAGKAVYTKCAPCHGVRGDGGPGNDLIPAAPSLVDAMWDHGSTDGEIFDSIKNGVPPELNMVPFKDQLQDQEIWNVVNYIRSIAREK